MGLIGGAWGTQTGTMPNIGAQNITPGTSSQTISAGYHNGAGQVAGDADLDPANIKSGVNIFDVVGTYTGTGTSCTCNGTLVRTRWCDNGNGTVTDMLGNTVGGKLEGRCLVWLKKADWGGVKPWRVNVLNSYDDAHTRAGTLSGGAMDADLTDGSVEGAWRLPTLNELRSLTTGTAPILTFGDTSPFTGVQSYSYWSSTTLASTTGGAWVVYLGGGGVGADGKTYGNYVWPVRGGL